MRYTLSIDSATLSQTFANKLLASFIPQATISTNPTLGTLDGWYNNTNTQFTTLHNQLTSLILTHIGDLKLNTSETYVYITYFL
jgi:hypothetical protein